MFRWPVNTSKCASSYFDRSLPLFLVYPLYLLFDARIALARRVILGRILTLDGFVSFGMAPLSIFTSSNVPRQTVAKLMYLRSHLTKLE